MVTTEESETKEVPQFGGEADGVDQFVLGRPHRQAPLDQVDKHVVNRESNDRSNNCVQRSVGRTGTMFSNAFKYAATLSYLTATPSGAPSSPM